MWLDSESRLKMLVSLPMPPLRMMLRLGTPISASEIERCLLRSILSVVITITLLPIRSAGVGRRVAVITVSSQALMLLVNVRHSTAMTE